MRRARFVEGKLVGELPAPAPEVYAPNPADHWTPGSAAWLTILAAAAVTQAYGIHRDKVDPLNRGKWTATSNVRPLGGFDSVTGLPLDVPFGAARRSALIIGVAGGSAWALWHWTHPRGRY